MLPVRDNQSRNHVSWVTWTIIGLNCFIYLWDRRWHLGGSGVVFADLVMRPREVIEGLSLRGDPFALVGLFTSMFLHANLIHLLGNMLFLATFGVGVEAALGAPRFALYYLMWGIVAGLSQCLVDPSSLTATLGASGAIGGVLGCYLLLFPANKIEVLVPILAFLSFEISAWILLCVWFLYQILAPQEGVANWAHAGGFTAGMLTVLMLGGRRKLLARAEASGQLDP